MSVTLAALSLFLTAVSDDCRKSIDEAALQQALSGPPRGFRVFKLGTCLTLESRFDVHGAPQYWAVRDSEHRLRQFVIPRNSNADRALAVRVILSVGTALLPFAEIPGVFTMTNFELAEDGTHYPSIQSPPCRLGPE